MKLPPERNLDGLREVAVLGGEGAQDGFGGVGPRGAKNHRVEQRQPVLRSARPASLTELRAAASCSAGSDVRKATSPASARRTISPSFSEDAAGAAAAGAGADGDAADVVDAADGDAADGAADGAADVDAADAGAGEALRDDDDDDDEEEEEEERARGESGFASFGSSCSRTSTLRLQLPEPFALCSRTLKWYWTSSDRSSSCTRTVSRGSAPCCAQYDPRSTVSFSDDDRNPDFL